MARDRILSGFVAGVLAGIAMNIPDWIGYGLGIHERRLLDWAAVAIYGELPRNTFELVFSQIGQLAFAGLLGSVFASLILKLTSKNQLTKGVLYSIAAWFLLYAIPVMFHISQLETAETALPPAHLVSAIVYGIVLPMTMDKLDQIDQT